MSRKNLAGMFDVLSPEERTSLTFAATVRGDEAELERLMSTAPRHTVSEMHHTGVARALCICGLIHRAEQLDMIAGHMFSKVNVHQAVDDEDCETAVWWAKMAHLFAYRYCLNKDAWRLFCDEKGVRGEHVVDGGPGGWLVELADNNMPDIAPSDEEITELMQGLVDQEIDASDLVTPEKEMQDWQALYRGLLGR